MHVVLVEQISLSKTVSAPPSIKMIENDPGCIGRFHKCREYDKLKDTRCRNMVIMIRCQLISICVYKDFCFSRSSIQILNTLN